MIIAFVNIVSAIAGIVCLLMGRFTPFYILIAVFLITSLVEILIRLKAGVSRRPKSR
nr:J324 [uncultured bacterium]